MQRVAGALGVSIVRDQSRVSGGLLVVTAASLWGLWSLFFRPAERLAVGAPVTAAAESFVMMAVMLVVATPLACASRLRRVGGWAQLRPPRASTWALGLALGVTDALNALFFFKAMQTTTLAVAVLTHYLAPALVALAAPLLARERLARATVVSLAIALFGLLLLLSPWRSSADVRVEGAVFGALSAVFYAANVLLGKRLLDRLSSVEIIAWPKVASILVIGLTLPADGLSFGLTSGLILVAGSLVCGAFAIGLFYTGLARVPASQASVLTLFEPLVAVVVGAVVWSELPGPWGVVGGAMILWAAWRLVRPPTTT